ncbi:MAG TPA: nucleotide exchange factor GrpE [Candidatus Paceibacterota bacterium]
MNPEEEKEIKVEETIDEEIVPEDGEGAVETTEAKLKKLREELKQCQTEKQDYLAMAQRLKADYLNLQRDAASAKDELIKFATEPLLRQILELADSFELAFSNHAAWQSVDANWRTGVEYIYAKLQNILEQSGLKEILASDELFDPLKHHALELIETKDRTKVNRIIEVVQKGYTLYGKIIRPAQVRVGK